MDRAESATAAERKRWAKLVKAWGYPFDWTNEDGIPEPDMVAAIVDEWMADPKGYADEERWICEQDTEDAIAFRVPK